jgi:hypothetical protein
VPAVPYDSRSDLVAKAGSDAGNDDDLPFEHDVPSMM